MKLPTLLYITNLAYKGQKGCIPRNDYQTNINIKIPTSSFIFFGSNMM